MQFITQKALPQIESALAVSLYEPIKAFNWLESILMLFFQQFVVQGAWRRKIRRWTSGDLHDT